MYRDGDRQIYVKYLATGTVSLLDYTHTHTHTLYVFFHRNSAHFFIVCFHLCVLLSKTLKNYKTDKKEKSGVLFTYSIPFSCTFIVKKQPFVLVIIWLMNHERTYHIIALVISSQKFQNKSSVRKISYVLSWEFFIL